MGNQELNYVFYTEDGKPFDSTIRTIELPTNEKSQFKGNMRADVTLKFSVEYLSFTVEFSKLQSELFRRKLANKGTKYHRYMCWLERKKAK